MYKVIAESGDPNGDLISEHETIEQAQGALLDAIETDAENLLWYGIPDRDSVPTYAEAMEYARDFFYIVEGE